MTSSGFEITFVRPPSSFLRGDTVKTMTLSNLVSFNKIMTSELPINYDWIKKHISILDLTISITSLGFEITLVRRSSSFLHVI
jgi:hypothetical protein